MHNEFNNLEKGPMFIAEFGARFLSLSKYVATSISIESKQIWKFVRGLDSTYQLTTTQMVVLGASFQVLLSILK